MERDITYSSTQYTAGGDVISPSMQDTIHHTHIQYEELPSADRPTSYRRLERERGQQSYTVPIIIS